jgi:amino acid adenylation domain-containing protein
VGFDYLALTPFKSFQPWNSDYNFSLEFYDLPQHQTEFDLSLVVIDQAMSVSLSLPFSLNCTFIYNRNLLDAATIERMAQHWQRLLQAIATQATQPIARLPLLNQAELHQILVEWNDTKTEYDLKRGLHEWIEAQVERTPDAIAVRFEQQILTYAELNGQANQLAHFLQELGVQPETLVGICAERSLQMVIGLLGILKAGGAYVPLDPDYPPERLQMMLEDARMPILLTQAHLLERLPLQENNIVDHVLCLDRDWQRIAIAPDANPISNIQPDHLAYVIYTSGSTGTPKGAMNTHRGICNRLLWMQGQYGLTESDRVLQKTPFSFDVSIWEFFWPLMVGAQLVLAVPQGHRDSFYLVDLIDKAQITTLHFVPAMLQVFLETPGLERCGCLKRVICSGEALPLSLQERFFDRLHCELHNLYGPTEAAIDVTCWRCQPDDQLNSVPIGRPIANTQLYILDTHLQPVPIGVTGELYIGGMGVARGYLNRPDLTAARFVANPFAVAGQETTLLYRTGDLTYYRHDGVIEYVGRADYQVKIRGFRIELGEIEQVLTQHEQVREAVVTVVHNLQNQSELVAYVVTYEDVSPQALRDFLKRKLPEYMVPAVVICLPSMPLTPSGKVDRRSLPQPDRRVLDQHLSFVAPRHAVEVQLAQIWSDVLQLPKIGVNDDFFELGGDSLIAMRLMQAIAQQFGQALPLATLLAHRTIAEMAMVLQSVSHPLPQPPLIALQTQGHKPPFFCVHPAGGHVLCYANLSRYMGNDQPFYGLQAQGFNGDKTPLERVEDMARLYVNAMTTFCPEGPYQIGGWSFGGVVAYEMAQQLHRRGQIVSRLAILDSYVPILLNPSKVIDDAYLVGVLSRVFGGMFGLDNLVSPQEIRHLKLSQQIDYIIEKAKGSGIFPPQVEHQQNRRILEVLVGTLRATYAYHRQPYPGKVTVFRAREKHVMAPDPQLVWVELFAVLDAIDIEVINVPGNHYSFILEPHVQALGRAIADYLA